MSLEGLARHFLEELDRVVAEELRTCLGRANDQRFRDDVATRLNLVVAKLARDLLPHDLPVPGVCVQRVKVGTHEICIRCSYPLDHSTHFAIGLLSYCRSVPGQQLYMPTTIPAYDDSQLKVQLTDPQHDLHIESVTDLVAFLNKGRRHAP